MFVLNPKTGEKIRILNSDGTSLWLVVSHVKNGRVWGEWYCDEACTELHFYDGHMSLEVLKRDVQIKIK